MLSLGPGLCVAESAGDYVADAVMLASADVLTPLGTVTCLSGG